jgi:hypothetical protein
MVSSLFWLIILSTAMSTQVLASDSQNAPQGSDGQSSSTEQTPSSSNDAGNPKENESFLSRVRWTARFGLSDFQVENSHTPGISAGLKGRYETAGGIRLKLLLTTTIDIDTDHLDSDHIPVWFKSYLKAEKDFFTISPGIKLLGTGDLEHKMNTVSSIEQSADLMAGLKLQFETQKAELFAKVGAGGYYLEIDDDLPEEYSDYRREDLGSSEFAWFQEYKGKLKFAEKFSICARYKKFRSMDNMSLETRKEIKLAYQFQPTWQFVLKAEKTWYNLDQFERSAGDNGLEVLPFDEDTHYQAYVEFGF